MAGKFTHIIMAINKSLKRGDPFAEKQGRKPGRNPDHKSNEPELDLAGSPVTDDLPALTQRVPCGRDLAFDRVCAVLGHARGLF